MTSGCVARTKCETPICIDRYCVLPDESCILWCGMGVGNGWTPFYSSSRYFQGMRSGCDIFQVFAWKKLIAIGMKRYVMEFL